mmetsp:Transcript_52103/g.62783  ORF Transcript_52103/g.62783 Transcript_52103/m.62783 type:complete len:149 (+) Transcript_52103:301-747(+)
MHPPRTHLEETLVTQFQKGVWDSATLRPQGRFFAEHTRLSKIRGAGAHPDLWEDRRVRGHDPRRRRPPGRSHASLALEHFELVFFVSPFLKVISQTCPSLPSTILRRPDHHDEYTESAYKVANKLLSIGILMGLIMAGLASSIPRFVP